MLTLYDTFYRPPAESGSALLEVSVGCSYGACTFCRLANNATPLQLVSWQMLGQNLLELVCHGETATRMFLTGENVLAFQTRYLLDIFQYVKSFLPCMTEFAMYSRADDIARKTDKQLKNLRDSGLNTLYVGVESGNAHILKNCNKGETPKEIVAQLHRLDELGIHYGLSSILGLGGTALWREHALDTAALYNSVRPVSLRVMTLTPMEGTPLASAVDKGQFELSPPQLILREELLLLESIDYTDHVCHFWGNHISNAVPVQGKLPTDRQRMVERLHNAINQQEEIPQQAPVHSW